MHGLGLVPVAWWWRLSSSCLDVLVVLKMMEAAGLRYGEDVEWICDENLGSPSIYSFTKGRFCVLDKPRTIYGLETITNVVWFDKMGPAEVSTVTGTLNILEFCSNLGTIFSYELSLGRASTRCICMDEGYNTMILDIYHLVMKNWLLSTHEMDTSCAYNFSILPPFGSFLVLGSWMFRTPIHTSKTGTSDKILLKLTIFQISHENESILVIMHLGHSQS
jgi:hypothetical protein